MNHHTLLADRILSDPPVSRHSPLVALNFKVPLRVRQQFKVHAARQNMKMTELLLTLLDDYLNSDATNADAAILRDKEIKK